MWCKNKKSKLFAFVAVGLCCLFVFSLLPKSALAVSVSDNFNRANGGLGSNWTTMAGTAAPVISGNKVVPGTGGTLNSAYWTADSFTSDQYAQAAMPSVPDVTNHGPGIGVRLSDSRGYILWYGNSNDTVSIWRMDGTNPVNWIQLQVSSSLTLSPTDVWQFTAVGSTISGYQNGSLVVQTTDATYTTGSPGVWMYYGSNQVDDWSGGDIVPGGTYTIGGTVTGLTGTVVLQNNGTDDLSRSSNGAFTFSNTAGAYNVTVQTQPLGQTCVVGNGLGSAVANVNDVTVSCTNNSVAKGTDNFNRADGALGSGWADMTGSGLAISSQNMVGTSASYSGDIRTNETYNSNQYSQIEITATQLSGGQWVAPVVRAQGGGSNMYAGLYFWNNGSPILQIYRRQANVWTALGTPYSTSPLAAGAKLKLMVVGSTLSLLVDGVERATVSDTNLTAGAPGIMAYDTPVADNWSGGNAGFETHYLSTDGNGVESYDMISSKNGRGAQVLRVLRPTSPAPGVRHNFIFLLPVEAGLLNSYGDGVDTLRALNAQNQYNLTIIEPSFNIESWYADNPLDSALQYETFMTNELEPWAKQNLATTGYEQNWLMGFSKSGIGGMDLLLKHPDLFSVGAAWDWPADLSAYNGCCSSAGNYGTDPNFQANYRLTSSFMDAHKAPFLTNNRIWIGGYNAFQTDVADFDTLLTSKGMAHTTETPTPIAHRWDSGWVPVALTALYQDSINLPDTNPPSVTAFTIASASNSLTVPITSFTGTDDIGVTGYKLTESSLAPVASDAGWSGTAQGSYTFTSVGSKTLYAWVKDAGGNVSPSASAPVTITPFYTLGGTISGLSGTLVLRNAVDGQAFSISSSGPFSFDVLASGQNYNVAVQTQPHNQTCSVTSGTGTVPSANVTGIRLSCASPGPTSSTKSAKPKSSAATSTTTTASIAPAAAPTTPVTPASSTPSTAPETAGTPSQTVEPAQPELKPHSFFGKLTATRLVIGAVIIAVVFFGLVFVLRPRQP